MFTAGPKTARAVTLAAAATALVTAAPAHAETKYVFRPVAFLDAPAPGGDVFTLDFQPSDINDRGTIAFTAGTASGGEAVYQFRDGELVKVARSGDPAPGGGKFSGQGELGRLGLNESDAMSVPFHLDPFPGTAGLNGAVFRFTAATGALTPVARPGTRSPLGGKFKGVHFDTGINDAGDVVFTGLAPGTDINTGVAPGTYGIAAAVFEQHNGVLRAVVKPGDRAPGGGVFDMARDPRINNAGDVTFGGHVFGEECISPRAFTCFENVYVKHPNGTIESIAHQGQAAPGGGTFRFAYGALINDAGDIAFLGDLSAPGATFESGGVYLRRAGALTAVARPGQAMPGGGHLTLVESNQGLGLNEDGDVSFVADLDTGDKGAYLYSGGVLQLIARTGTVIPGLGTVSDFGLDGTTGGALNRYDQLPLSITLTDGRTVLVRASPVGAPGA